MSSFHKGSCSGCEVLSGDAYLSVAFLLALTKIFMQEAMDETFLLSNIAPQVGVGFNRHCTSDFSPAVFFFFGWLVKRHVFLLVQIGHT
jgi:hypothetical protein